MTVFVSSIPVNIYRDSTLFVEAKKCENPFLPWACCRSSGSHSRTSYHSGRSTGSPVQGLPWRAQQNTGGQWVDSNALLGAFQSLHKERAREAFFYTCITLPVPTACLHSLSLSVVTFVVYSAGAANQPENYFSHPLCLFNYCSTAHIHWWDEQILTLRRASWGCMCWESPGVSGNPFQM